jgi:glycosyltransferase involved in cell wall biosynthesis
MKITFAVPHSGCAFWRARQPALMLRRLGLADVKIFDSFDIDATSMEEMLEWGDVIVQQSSMGVNSVAATAKYKEMGKVVVGDYDDLSFSLSPFNPAYKTLGLNEVKIKIGEGDERYLWQDGKGGFSKSANYFRYKSLQDLLKLFDTVTTTTKFIKNRYSEFAQDIKILPNSINFDLFKPFEKRPHDQIRIGWYASDSHYAEIWMVKRIMRKIFNKYGDKVKFVVLGNIYELGVEFKPHEMERHEWVGLDIYPMKMAALDLDIGLCPLDKIDFNRAKSQLKWSEYSAIKVPTVCSKLEPYECVEDGRTGMIGDSEDEFYDKLCELIDNADLREKISYLAYDKNYEDYNLEKNAILWLEAYEQAREKCEFQSSGRGVSARDTLKTYQI